MKEANLKKLPTVWFQVKEILGKTKLQHKRMSGCQELEERVGEGGWIGEAQEIRAVQLLYGTIIVHKKHYAFVEIHWTLTLPDKEQASMYAIIFNVGIPGRVGNPRIDGVYDQKKKKPTLLQKYKTTSLNQVGRKCANRKNFENKWNL